jgi:hypothetical protein
MERMRRSFKFHDVLAPFLGPNIKQITHQLHWKPSARSTPRTASIRARAFADAEGGPSVWSSLLLDVLADEGDGSAPGACGKVAGRPQRTAPELLANARISFLPDHATRGLARKRKTKPASKKQEPAEETHALAA